MGPITVDGRLDESSWVCAPRSPRFADLVNGTPGIHDTRASVLWDDDYLYVGYWVEEPMLDVWRMDFSRFNTYKQVPPANDHGGWAWSPHGVWDSHVPECFPYITFSDQPVSDQTP